MTEDFALQSSLTHLFNLVTYTRHTFKFIFIFILFYIYIFIFSKNILYNYYIFIYICDPKKAYDARHTGIHF